MNEELILNVETLNPYVIGAVAYVEQLENGAKITIVDKNGTTTATVYDGTDCKSISSIVLNDDYTLTINYTDGDATTTGSIRGETGDSGVYYGEEEPSDPAVNVWVDPTDGFNIPNPPTADGTYVLQATVLNGTTTYSWVSAE